MDRRVVGTVVRPHGIRGEVAIRIETDDPATRFRPGSRVLWDDRELVIETSRPHGGRQLIRFAGIGDRTAAEGLRDALLTIPAAEARALREEEFWPEQLVGLAVVQGGVVRGEITAVLAAPAHDLLEVALATGGTALVPFVAALTRVTEVGVEVAPLPGLLDT